MRLQCLPDLPAQLLLSVDSPRTADRNSPPVRGLHRRTCTAFYAICRLPRSRRAAEYCAEHLGWTTVHCTHSDAMRSIEDIQAEVQGIVLGGQ